MGRSRPCDGAAALKRIMFAGARYDLLNGLPTAEGTRPKLGPKAEPERRKNSENTEERPQVQMFSGTDRGLRNCRAEAFGQGYCGRGYFSRAHGRPRRRQQRRQSSQNLQGWRTWKQLNHFTSSRPTIKRFGICGRARVLRPWYFFQRTRPTTTATAAQTIKPELARLSDREQ